jgi:hypothetical protein
MTDRILCYDYAQSARRTMDSKAAEAPTFQSRCRKGSRSESLTRER